MNTEISILAAATISVLTLLVYAIGKTLYESWFNQKN